MSFIYLVETDNEGAAASLAMKLAEKSKPGAIILLTKDEFEIVRNMHVVEIDTVINPGVHTDDT